MTIIKKNADPVKEKLIRLLEELETSLQKLKLDAPQEREAISTVITECDDIIKTLQRKEIIISNLQKRKNVTMKEVEREVAEYLDVIFNYLCKKGLAYTSESPRPLRKK